MNGAKVLRLMRLTKTAGSFPQALKQGDVVLGKAGRVVSKGLEGAGVKNPLLLGAAKQSGRLGAVGVGYGAYQGEVGQSLRDRLAQARMQRMQKKQRVLSRNQQVDMMKQQLRHLGR